MCRQGVTSAAPALAPEQATAATALTDPALAPTPAPDDAPAPNTVTARAPSPNQAPAHAPVTALGSLPRQAPAPLPVTGPGPSPIAVPARGPIAAAPDSGSVSVQTSRGLVLQQQLVNFGASVPIQAPAPGPVMALAFPPGVHPSATISNLPLLSSLASRDIQEECMPKGQMRVSNGA